MVHTRFSSSSGSPSYSKNSPQNIKKDNKKRPLSGQAKGKKTTKQKKPKLANVDHIIPSPQVYFQFHCCNILILVFFLCFIVVCLCNMCVFATCNILIFFVFFFLKLQQVVVVMIVCIMFCLVVSGCV